MRPIALAGGLTAALLLAGCPSTPWCSSSNCPMGCCAADGRCELGTQSSACGTLGGACLSCQPSQECASGVCVASGGGSGGGGGSSGGGGTGGNAGGAGPDGGRPPLIISASAASTFESESHVVSTASGRVVAVYMALGTSNDINGYAISEDRGDHWSSPMTMQGVTSLGDPVATVGADQSVYVGFLDGTCTATGCNNGHAWVARLAPGSSVFGAPVDASPANAAEFYDKPWFMTADDGTLLLVYNAREGEYPNNVDSIVVSRSADGQSWTRSLAVPRRTGQIAGIPHACLSKQSGRVWVVFVDSLSPNWGSIVWSDDRGATWPVANASSSFAPASVAARLQSYDFRCAGEGNDVWVMYGLSSGASSQTAIPILDEIRVVHSGNAGVTWDSPTSIRGTGQFYLRPELIVESSGALSLLAYSGAREGDPAGTVRRWRSTDHGVTFVEQPAVFGPMRFTGDRAGTAWVGDYSGLAQSLSDLLITAVDNSSGRAHTFFARVPLN